MFEKDKKMLSECTSRPGHVTLPASGSLSAIACDTTGALARCKVAGGGPAQRKLVILLERIEIDELVGHIVGGGQCASVASGGVNALA